MGRQGDESKWPYGGAIDAAKSFGAVMVDMDVGEVCVDQKNKIVSSPAFMSCTTGNFMKSRTASATWSRSC